MYILWGWHPICFELQSFEIRILLKYGSFLVTRNSWTKWHMVMQLAPKWYTAYALSDDTWLNGLPISINSWLYMSNIGMLWKCSHPHLNKELCGDGSCTKYSSMHFPMISMFVLTPPTHPKIHCQVSLSAVSQWNVMWRSVYVCRHVGPPLVHCSGPWGVWNYHLTLLLINSLSLTYIVTVFCSILDSHYLLSTSLSHFPSQRV